MHAFKPLFFFPLFFPCCGVLTMKELELMLEHSDCYSITLLIAFLFIKGWKLMLTFCIFCLLMGKIV